MSDNTNDNNEKLIVHEDEKHLVLDHSYDGIQELNHPLPSWWSGMWILSFVFMIPYFMYYVLMDGPTLRETYKKDMAAINKLKEEAAKSGANFSLEEYNSWVAANDGVQKGKIVFEENCLSCHGEGGRGDIGPNLTDDYWINVKGHVGADTIYPIVFNGVEENGMPVWSEVLSKEDIMAAVAFVLTLHGTNPPDAKEAQGELLK